MQLRSTHLRRVIQGAFAILAVVALPTHAANHFVTIQGTTFVPDDLLIHTGDTVFWTNTDGLQHTVTSGNPCSPNGTFNSGVMDPDAQFSFTFTNLGSFNYYCVFHCIGGMRGNVTVEEPPTPVTPRAPSATLGQNYPNPFNPSTTIEYSLPTRTHAALSIFDSEGALVVRLDQGIRDAGPHHAEWNGRDRAGKPVGSGVYFYRLDGVTNVAPRKMVLLK
jgi:plastocyanin